MNPSRSRTQTSPTGTRLSLSASALFIALLADLTGCSSNANTAAGSGGAPAAAGGWANASGGAASGGAPGAGGGSASGGAASGDAGASGGTGAGSGGAASGGGPGGGTGGDARGGGGEPGGSGGRAMSNCDGSSLAPGEMNRTIDVGGVSRKFIQHVPPGYTGSEPLPLVIDFHGLGGTGSQEKGSSGFAALADREGFLILWPDGLDNGWNVGPCCTNSREVDDVGFARAMVDAVAAVACVDMKRVYATGFSNGGGMSNYVACHAADVFAAIAPSAFDLLEDDLETCKPSRPISVFSMRGTQDPAVPFEGGRGGGNRVTFLGAQPTLEKWAELAGCEGAPTTPVADTQLYTSCSESAQVGLLTIQGGGHAPGPAATAWEFLKTKALP